MTREEKGQIIQQLSDQLAEYPHFYLADTSAMSVEEVNNFRRQLFEKGLISSGFWHRFSRDRTRRSCGAARSSAPAGRGRP